MNTNWLLFKTERKSLLPRALFCFFLSFSVGSIFSGPDLGHAAMISAFALLPAQLFAVEKGYYTALFNLPFPVTHRQLAWIPTLWIAVLWAAGLAGACFAGVGFTGAWTSMGVLAVVKIIPFAFLIFSVVDRLLRDDSKFHAVIICLLIIFFSNTIMSRFDELEGINPDPVPLKGLEPAVAFYEYGWPLCIVLGIFFILEGPAHIAAMDYPVRMKPEIFGRRESTRPPGAPIRAPAIKIWADLLMSLMWLPPCIWYLSRVVAILDLDSMSMAARVGGAMFFMWAMRCVWLCWRSARVNGFSVGKTVVIFFLKCSIVLSPIARALGHRDGDVTKCVQCRRYKFLWACQCPHCGHASHGGIVRDLLNT